MQPINTNHVCQDLHQANWAAVPRTDIGIASPCCQGHAKARGKKNGNPEHDASRSTAWLLHQLPRCCSRMPGWSRTYRSS